MRRNNRKYCVALIAGIAAAIGVIVAVGVYLRKKASIIGEQLDFDPDMFDDEDYFDEEVSSMGDAIDEAVEGNEAEYESMASDEQATENFSNNADESTNKSE